MMNMGVSQKVKAALHLLIGQQPISVQFETNEGAEREWRTTTSLIGKGDDYLVHHCIITHENGAVWIRLSAVNAVTWTKEARVTAPMGGGGALTPGSNLRM